MEILPARFKLQAEAASAALPHLGQQVAPKLPTRSKSSCWAEPYRENGESLLVKGKGLCASLLSLGMLARLLEGEEAEASPP